MNRDLYESAEGTKNCEVNKLIVDVEVPNTLAHGEKLNSGLDVRRLRRDRLVGRLIVDGINVDRYFDCRERHGGRVNCWSDAKDCGLFGLGLLASPVFRFLGLLTLARNSFLSNLPLDRHIGEPRREQRTGNAY